MRFVVYFLLMFSLPVVLIAHHDFDSLYDASENFRDFFNSHYSNRTLFESDEIIKVSIISDFKTFNRRRDNEQYQDAILQYF